MEYQIEFAPRAYLDADEVYTWISQHSVRNAIRWYQRLLKTIGTLSRNPGRCPSAADAAAFRDDVRQLLFGRRRGTYRILFSIKGDTVRILRIIHHARRLFTEADER
jgi:plasmid stabilization system protein ParE